MKKPTERKTVYRNAAPRNFTTIPNATLRDKALSLEARGLLGFVLSFPQDWHFRIKWLVAETGTGRDRCYRLISDLIDAGYCKRVDGRNSKGIITGWEYLFTDTPHKFGDGATSDCDPLPENQEVDRAAPLPENPEVEQKPNKNPLPEKPSSGKPGSRQRDIEKETNKYSLVSSRARADARSETKTVEGTKVLDDLKNQVRAIEQTPALRATVHTLRLDSPQGKAWLEHWETLEREDLVAEARLAGKIRVVGSMWPPKADSP